MLITGSKSFRKIQRFVELRKYGGAVMEYESILRKEINDFLQYYKMMNRDIRGFITIFNKLDAVLISVNQSEKSITRETAEIFLASFSVRFSSEVSAIESKKSQKKSISNFSTEEIQIILSLPKKSNDTELRNRAILCFLYGSGARAQELCNLRVSDVKFGEKTSVRLLGKGNKRRVVVLPTACANILKEHILRCDISQYGERHVFSSHTHEKMSVSCVEAIVAKYVRIAKKEYSDLFREEHYSPHSFRHSIAVHMLEADIPLPVIKTFLGHENIQTTMVYATVSDRVKDKYLLNRYFPNTAHEDELKNIP